ncbi:hypothetical protein [Phytoactinopolyspora endophytica]|uniref:hypothetical protein n=1 Tax=Phytoactinopolyspora endophytica TaxID=1642495 RepID=UPI00101C801B|nr:hypothetical protein [Phytoactinopolyspora endophytica]
MHGHQGPVRLAALVAVIATVSAGCSSDSSVQQDGTAVQNADEVIEQADTIFNDLVKEDVDDGTATVSEDSRCYFLRVDDDDNVDSNVYCGPVRTLGGDDDEAWYALPSDGVEDPEEGLLLQLPPTDDVALTSVAVDDLVRPDDEEPIDVSAVEEPQAPEAPVSDFAALAEAADLELTTEFTDLDEPYRLVTPSATLTVEAVAELDVIPTRVVGLARGSTDVPDDDGEDSEDGGSVSAPFYRPVDGQQVQAWRVTIGSPPEIGPEVDRWSDDDGRDASTAYALGAGSQRLSITGALTEDGGSAEIACELVPCEERNQTQYTLVASGTADAPMTLVATVDGTDQVLDLDTGELTGDVSQVAHSRTDTFQQVSTTWGTETIHLADEEEICGYCDALDYNFGGEVQRVYLSPFAAKKGWAPAGQAWLIIPIANDPASLTGDYLGGDTFAEASIDLTTSWTLEVDGENLSHDPDAALGYTAAFLVEDTFTEGTFRYGPAGSVSYTDPDRTEPLETEEPLTLDISFP